MMTGKPLLLPADLADKRILHLESIISQAYNLIKYGRVHLAKVTLESVTKTQGREGE